MNLSPLARIGRSGLAAGLSTFTALAFHVLGGGMVPSAAGIAVPLVLSFAVAIQLSTHPLSRWRLGLTAALSQVGFHFLFVIGGASGGHLALSGHEGHDPTLLATALHAAPAMHVHSASGMAVSHVLAAIVTYAVLRRAETLVHLLTTAVGFVRAAIVRLDPPAPVAIRPLALAHVPTAPAAPLLHRHLSSGGTRGPPASAR